MKWLLQWIRNFSGATLNPVSKRDAAHYARFEEALEQGDVEAYIYEEYGRKGQVVLLKGEDLHAVTPQNLVSFRRLNRAHSRSVRKSMHATLKRYT